MGLTKPIEQYLFSNLLTRIHVVVYLKDIIRGDFCYEKYQKKNYADNSLSIDYGIGFALTCIGFRNCQYTTKCDLK